ncbi:MAG: GNAT family acetyltransferase [Cycloclasticus sp.]|nr:MAG: GNAT family acetyltransferase [Cycloclasticus sp.]
MSTDSLESAVFRETNTVFDLNSFDEDKLAIIKLMDQAQTEVNIFSHVLCPKIFDTDIVIRACENFCLKNHRTKINILIKDSRPITRISHRLLGLSHKLSSSIFFKKLNPTVSMREDDFVCFDRSAYFKLPNNEHYAGNCNFADADYTAHLLSFFKDAWERSEPDVEFRSAIL